MRTPRFALFKDIYREGVKPGRFLWVLALYGISYGFYRGVQDNYLADVLKITAFQRGIVEFFRETPGLLVVLILAWMYRFTETRVFKIGIGVMVAGLIGLILCTLPAWDPPGSALPVVVVVMVLFSTGEHVIMPVRTTITLNLAAEGKGGAALGIAGSLSHIGNIAGFVMVTGFFALITRWGFTRADVLPFRIVFIVSMFLMLIAFFTVIAIQDTEAKVKRRRVYFARKFQKYYMLEVFYGARKQIFITFAPFVLIRYYGAPTSIISLLLGICAVFGTILSPFMGKLIDKLGYKFIMVTDTLLLVVVCILYGFAHRIFPQNIAFWVVCINYVLDSIISMASMASNVYVQSIASSQEEITATLSTGVSVNHVISILIALLGGYIWDAVGIEALFTLSAILGVINSIYAATIKKNEGQRPAAAAG
ncbi:MAG: MFS transporter [Treponema sp.]|jgi:MFS family permease|nr:MFS transporter [Treponema sp.]